MRLATLAAEEFQSGEKRWVSDAERHAVLSNSKVILLQQSKPAVSGRDGNHTEAHLEVRQEVLEVGGGAWRRRRRRRRLVEVVGRRRAGAQPQVEDARGGRRHHRARTLVSLWGAHPRDREQREEDISAKATQSNSKNTRHSQEEKTRKRQEIDLISADQISITLEIILLLVKLCTHLVVFCFVFAGFVLPGFLGGFCRQRWST